MTDNDLATMNGAICSPIATFQYCYQMDGINPCSIDIMPYALAILETDLECLSMIPYFASIETVHDVGV